MRCATTNLVVYSTRCSSRERILATISCTNNMLTKPRSTSTANPSTALATSLGFVLSSKHLRWNTLMVWSSEDDDKCEAPFRGAWRADYLLLAFRSSPRVRTDCFIAPFPDCNCHSTREKSSGRLDALVL